MTSKPARQYWPWIVWCNSDIENSSSTIKCLLKCEVSNVASKAFSKVFRITHQELLWPGFKSDQVKKYWSKMAKWNRYHYLPSFLEVVKKPSRIVVNLSNCTWEFCFRRFVFHGEVQRSEKVNHQLPRMTQCYSEARVWENDRIAKINDLQTIQVLSYLLSLSVQRSLFHILRLFGTTKC